MSLRLFAQILVTQAQGGSASKVFIVGLIYVMLKMQVFRLEYQDKFAGILDAIVQGHWNLAQSFVDELPL